jgi:predicted transcriptional regulator
MLALLREREMSPSELARECDEVVGVAAYHVRVLLEAGLVELVRTAPNRGAVQHFYRATNTEPIGEVLMLSKEAAAQLAKDLRNAVDRARSHPGDVPVVVVAHHD